MQEMTLADCYGHAGLSPDAVNIQSRLEPFKKIAANLTHDQVLDAVRHYFGMPVSADSNWLYGPIKMADDSFSMVTNRRELAIISMALIAHEVKTEESQFAALAFLVASATGKRNPAIYPQFVEIVNAAAKDLMTSQRQSLDGKGIRARPLNKNLAGSAEDLVTEFELENLNRVLKELNSDSHELVEHLARQINAVMKPVRTETARLREETDMLWWLVGGESYSLRQPYLAMEEGRAAFLVGTDLAGLSRTALGPRANEFLINKALREGRTENSPKVKIFSLPKLFTPHELAEITAAEEIDTVRDLCCLNNAISRANQVGTQTGWRKMYAADRSLDDKTAFDPNAIALQSFREARLLDALAG